MAVYRIEAELRFINDDEADKWFNGVEVDEEPRMTMLSSREIPANHKTLPKRIHKIHPGD